MPTHSGHDHLPPAVQEAYAELLESGLTPEQTQAIMSAITKMISHCIRGE